MTYKSLMDRTGVKKSFGPGKYVKIQRADEGTLLEFQGNPVNKRIGPKVISGVTKCAWRLGAVKKKPVALNHRPQWEVKKKTLIDRNPASEGQRGIPKLG